ncbi:MAG: hypothetical protein M3680_25065, partial [Myxococcota bacterium]|nr:hypothetical protein [Myxococcota bacterium]
PGIVPVVLTSTLAPGATSWLVEANVDDVVAAIAGTAEARARGASGTAEARARGASEPSGAPHTLQLADSATVAGLATVLGALAYRDVASVTLTRAPKSRAKRP